MMVLREISVECSAKIAMTALPVRSRRCVYCLMTIRGDAFFPAPRGTDLLMLNWAAKMDPREADIEAVRP
jgi:hypothetical protein